MSKMSGNLPFIYDDNFHKIIGANNPDGSISSLVTNFPTQSAVPANFTGPAWFEDTGQMANYKNGFALKKKFNSQKNNPASRTVANFISTTGFTISNGTMAIDSSGVIPGVSSAMRVSTTSPGVTASLEKASAVFSSATNRYSIRFWVDDWTKVSAINFNLSTDAGFTTVIYYAYNIASLPVLQRNGLHCLDIVAGSGDNQMAGTALAAAAVIKFRISVAPVSGQNCSVIFGDIKADTLEKTAIVITADDGYVSWRDIGIPILEKYGLRHTLNFIADPAFVASNGASAMTPSDLPALVARGHDIQCHGATNLGDVYTAGGIDAVLADVGLNRSLITAATGVSPDHYAWPNGVFAPGFANGDTTLMDAMAKLGFKSIRGTSQRRISSTQPIPFIPCNIPVTTNNQAANYPNLFNLPIVSDTATDTGANIATALLNAAKFGGACFLMFHRVDEGGAISVTSANLETICAQIASLVAAGTHECMTVSEWYARYEQ